MNAMVILGIVMAVYASLGCTLFADDDPENFGSFSRAYFSLFQVRERERGGGEGRERGEEGEREIGRRVREREGDGENGGRGRGRA